MENRIQPILCCVGADVAGEPTQFLMERAVAAGHLDWHVITVEVTPEQLPPAWQGMDVMGFQAARFFAAHQAAAMRLVAEPTPQDAFIGGISSALRVGNAWQMWHNSGPSLVELLASRLSWSETLCWIHGDSIRTRSFLIACQALPPKKIYWTGQQPILPKSTTPSTDASVPNSQTTSTEVVPELLSSLPLLNDASTLESDLKELTAAVESPIKAIVHLGELVPKHLELLLECQPSFECALAVVSSAPGSRRKLNESWRAGEVFVFTPADLVVAEEAYDQLRWTGQPANMELLREAYEEYADF